ncbi:MAG: ATP-binding cassette domain-containing protein [Opitutales bacterium]|jgi:ABC-type phosphate/phosphonate transport system ATPase subunit
MNTREEPSKPFGESDFLLVARDLGLQVDDRWLFQKLHLELRAGEFIALSGPSGVGKTSLLHALAGMRKPTAGTICFPFLGPEQESIAEARKHLGIIFQDLLLTPNATLLQNVACGRLKDHSSLRTFFGFPSREQDSAFALLDELGLGAAVDKWVAETSRGEQQRVAIARALHQDPIIYLADEPVASLDEALADQVLASLSEQGRKEGKAILCVLHDARQIERFADRVIELGSAKPEGWSIRNKGESSQ